jgi:hypothetical protein
MQPGTDFKSKLTNFVADGACISTPTTGFLFQNANGWIGFLIVAGFAAAGTVLLWLFMTTTKPADYGD